MRVLVIDARSRNDDAVAWRSRITEKTKEPWRQSEWDQVRARTKKYAELLSVAGGTAAMDGAVR
jgi:hypothetical protein